MRQTPPTDAAAASQLKGVYSCSSKNRVRRNRCTNTGQCDAKVAAQASNAVDGAREGRSSKHIRPAASTCTCLRKTKRRLFMSLLGGVPLMCCGATIRCLVADEKAGGDGTYCPGASSRWVVVLGGGHGQTRKGVEATVFEQQIFN